MGARHPQSELNLLVTEILKSPYGRPTPNWPLGLGRRAWQGLEILYIGGSKDLQDPPAPTTLERRERLDGCRGFSDRHFEEGKTARYADLKTALSNEG
jgi:hypothetical protein